MGVEALGSGLPPRKLSLFSRGILLASKSAKIMLAQVAGSLCWCPPFSVNMRLEPVRVMIVKRALWAEVWVV